VRFDEPQLAVTPGQLAVMYVGERCLGGGEILRSLVASGHPDADTDRASGPGVTHAAAVASTAARRA
jgi:hypothetical protein